MTELLNQHTSLSASITRLSETKHEMLRMVPKGATLAETQCAHFTLTSSKHFYFTLCSGPASTGDPIIPLIVFILISSVPEN